MVISHAGMCDKSFWGRQKKKAFTFRGSFFSHFCYHYAKLCISYPIERFDIVNVVDTSNGFCILSHLLGPGLFFFNVAHLQFSRTF